MMMLMLMMMMMLMMLMMLMMILLLLLLSDASAVLARLHPLTRGETFWSTRGGRTGPGFLSAKWRRSNGRSATTPSHGGSGHQCASKTRRPKRWQRSGANGQQDISSVWSVRAWMGWTNNMQH